MKQLLSGLICLVLYTQVTAQSAVAPAPIQGWKMQENNGHYSYAPNALPGDIRITYDIFPPATGNSNLARLLETMAGKDISDMHYTSLPGKPSEQEIKNIQIYSVGVKDANGQQLLLNYMAYTRADGTVRYGRIIESPLPSIKPYMTTAVQHFMNICKKEAGLPQITAGATSKNTSRSNQETPVTAPGQGLKPSDMRGIAIHQETSFGVGGMMILVYRPYILLKDGTIYSHPSVSPYDLDVARSRREEPKQWGTYTLEGKNITVQFPGDKQPGKWETPWHWTRPANKDEKISGSYYTIGGGGNTAIGGTSMVVSSSNITFNNKGQFTNLSTGGGTYSDATGTVTAYSNKDAAGTYVLDGFGIELHYNNGTVVRQCFYFYDKTQEVFGMGGRDYVPSK